MKLNDNIYNILAFIGRTILPALAVLYVSLADTWGLPYATEISTTIMAVDLFLNTLLGISSNTYYKEQAKNSETEV